MKYNKTRKAFFLDRDGVIIKDVGYLTKIKQLSFLKDTLKTLKLINKKNYFHLFKNEIKTLKENKNFQFSFYIFFQILLSKLIKL